MAEIKKPNRQEIDMFGNRFLLIGDFYPGKPAPRASDHDDPRFSIPAEPCEIDIKNAYIIGWTYNGESRIELSKNMIEILFYGNQDALEEALWGKR